MINCLLINHLLTSLAPAPCLNEQTQNSQVGSVLLVVSSNQRELEWRQDGKAGAVQPGEVKFWGGLTGAFQCLKGHKKWRGTVPQEWE